MSSKDGRIDQAYVDGHVGRSVQGRYVGPTVGHFLGNVLPKVVDGLISLLCLTVVSNRGYGVDGVVGGWPLCLYKQKANVRSQGKGQQGLAFVRSRGLLEARIGTYEIR